MKDFVSSRGLSHAVARGRVVRFASMCCVMLGVAGAGALALGCVGGSAAAADLSSDAGVVSKSGRVRAEIMAEGAGLALGKNDLKVTLAPTSAAASTLTLVDATAFMPAHGHSADPPTVVKVDGGYELQNLTLFMAGRWELTLNIMVDGAPDSLELALDVP